MKKKREGRRWNEVEGQRRGERERGRCKKRGGGDSKGIDID